MKLYLTGGSVRDYMLRHDGTSDLDFAVEAESFDAMKASLAALGLIGRNLWQERPEFVTLRGRLPVGVVGDFGGVLRRSPDGTVAADFTLCRAEAMYSDKRHPDTVTPTDIITDLGRRDFTINAIAVSEGGEIIDPHAGATACAMKELRTVGDPNERFNEDPLRILRGVRFAVTRDLWIGGRTEDAMIRNAPLLATVKVERVREELNRALAFNWRETMLLLMVRMPMVGFCLHENFPNLWLKPTLEIR
jgi:tRNA nucleotidyltransferase/poly(A) polymerase